MADDTEWNCRTSRSHEPVGELSAGSETAPRRPRPLRIGGDGSELKPHRPCLADQRVQVGDELSPLPDVNTDELRSSYRPADFTRLGKLKCRDGPDITCRIKQHPVRHRRHALTLVPRQATLESLAARFRAAFMGRCSRHG